MKIKLISLLVAASLSATAIAETQSLKGQIVDENNQPVSHADVKIRNLKVSVKTDENGHFVINDLKHGRYVLDVETKNQGHINESVNHNGGTQRLVVGDNNVETMVITSNPLEHSSLEMTAPAVIIGGDELVKNRGANIGETLSEVSGVSLASFGVGAGSPVIRGQQGNRVTVLSNNSASQDASNSSPDHWIAAEPLLADRVEILKGPATLLYGGGAIGGAVNVVDKRIPTRLPNDVDGGAEVRLSDSAIGERSLVAGVTVPVNNVALRFEAFDSKTDSFSIPGYAESARLHAREEAEEEHGHEHEERSEESFGLLENSDTDTRGGAFGLSYITDKGYWGFSYSQYDRNYGLPGHSHAHHEEEHGHGHEEHEEAARLNLEQKRFDLRGVWEQPFSGIESLKIQYAKSDYQHREQEGGEAGTLFTNDAHELRLEAVHDLWRGWQGAFGFQWNASDFAALGEEAFIPRSDKQNLGLFWLGEIDTGKWHTELGLRVDRTMIETVSQSEYRATAFSFAAGTVYHFAENWSLPINFARAQRVPTVEELYSNAGNDEDHYVPHLATMTVEVGNPNLTKEIAYNFDIGLRYHTDNIHMNFALFRNSIDNFIHQQEEHHEDHGHGHEHELPIMEFAQRDAVFEGAEVELDWIFADSGSSFWSTGVFADYTHAEFTDGDYVPRVPAKRVGVKLGYNLNDFAANLKYTVAASQDKVAEEELATDGYNLLNVDLSYNLGFSSADALLFLRGNNLLNEEIRDHASYVKDLAPRVGRSISTGVRVTF